MIGDPGEDVGEPGYGIDIVKTTGGDHRQHDGGAFGAAQAAGEGPIAKAMPRNALSAALLLRQILPSSRKRAKSAQRLSM